MTSIKYIGMDVHKESISIAVRNDGMCHRDDVLVAHARKVELKQPLAEAAALIKPPYHTPGSV